VLLSVPSLCLGPCGFRFCRVLRSLRVPAPQSCCLGFICGPSLHPACDPSSRSCRSDFLRSLLFHACCDRSSCSPTWMDATAFLFMAVPLPALPPSPAPAWYTPWPSAPGTRLKQKYLPWSRCPWSPGRQPGSGRHHLASCRSTAPQCLVHD